ncbi:Phosphoribosylglycinamide formyltransferase [Polystyrenella longa]|uniref:Phosphoribosylglycinamide formyltransferase n=1 Tax=Polystyrenella longa TaxID=2528007 RepID=A0A518CSG7_9PLAN|nr:phosphoribosylglycinamide formyltransferase [Polystyrenella longa]QDU82158.1 Phosphoribosylglycinamide formyltransferase [Polystyrenella longa]
MTVQRPLQKTLDRPLRVGVLISGGGTTLLNFLEQKRAGQLDIEVPLVIASRPGITGIARAEKAGIHSEVICRKDFADVSSFSAAIFDRLREAQIDLVTLAGYLSLLEVPDDYRHRVMNIHPALIPAFCGKGYYGHHVHEAVVARGVKVTGCTVHFADNDYDHGPIIVQQTVPVYSTDDPDMVAARVFKAECEAYPEAIRLFASGRLTIESRQVHIDGEES